MTFLSKQALVVIDFKHWKLGQNYSKLWSHKIFIQDMQKSKAATINRSDKNRVNALNARLKKLSGFHALTRPIMVLMASFVTSQGVFSSIYSAHTRIRIQKYTLYKDKNQIYETCKNLGLCWENIQSKINLNSESLIHELSTPKQHKIKLNYFFYIKKYISLIL